MDSDRTERNWNEIATERERETEQVKTQAILNGKITKSCSQTQKTHEENGYWEWANDEVRALHRNNKN